MDESCIKVVANRGVVERPQRSRDGRKDEGDFIALGERITVFRGPAHRSGKHGVLGHSTGYYRNSMAALIEPQHLLPQGPLGSTAGIRSRRFGEEEDSHRVAAGGGFFALKIISQNPTYWQSRISYPSARRRLATSSRLKCVICSCAYAPNRTFP